MDANVSPFTLSRVDDLFCDLSLQFSNVDGRIGHFTLTTADMETFWPTLMLQDGFLATGREPEMSVWLRGGDGNVMGGIRRPVMVTPMTDSGRSFTSFRAGGPISVTLIDRMQAAHTIGFGLDGLTVKEIEIVGGGGRVVEGLAQCVEALP